MVESVRAFAAMAFPLASEVCVAIGEGPWHGEVVIKVVGRGEPSVVSLGNAALFDCTSPEDAQ